MVGTQSMSVEGKEGREKKEGQYKQINKQKYCPGGQGQHKALNTLSRSLEFIWQKTAYT